MVAQSGRATSGPYVLHLPDLGEGLQEADLIEWCVQVGQRVVEDDVLAKVETDKALVDIPSPRSGIIAALHGKPGQTIKVGSPLVTFREDPGATPTSPRPLQQQEPASAPAPHNGKSADQDRPADAGSVVGSLQHEAAGSSAGTQQPLAAPAVRRLARELGVDLREISGTGIGGRITAQDVRAAAGVGGPAAQAAAAPEPAGGESFAATAHTAPAAAGSSEPVTHVRLNTETVRIPLRGVRRTIAEHLRYSVSHAVHYTVMDEADVTALEVLRRKLVAASNEKISLLPFVASAMCRVLAGRQGAPFARLNSTVDDDHQEIVQHRAVHLGIATDTDEGLMVPVIRNAQALGVLELSRRIAELARAARERSIPRELLGGSTFTLSNFGSLAGRFGTPIINYPEAGILGIGRAREGVVVRDGMIGVGKLLPLSLAADHRVIDGATAAAALAKVIELLQAPEELLAPVEQER